MQTDFISEMTEGCEINARQVKGTQTLVPERSRCFKYIVRETPGWPCVTKKMTYYIIKD